MRNEKTSKRVARIAAKVLRLKWEWEHEDGTISIQPASKIKICLDFNGVGIGPLRLTLTELHALAASCLTQTMDTPKYKRRKP